MMSNKIQWVLLLFGLLSLKVAALDLWGEWIQGGLILGQTNPNHRVEFLGSSVQVADDGYFVIGMGRDTSRNVALIERTPTGGVFTHTFTVKQRQYQEQRVEGVPKKTVVSIRTGKITDNHLPGLWQDLLQVSTAADAFTMVKEAGPITGSILPHRKGQKSEPQQRGK
jgi:hypothetical protein